MKFFALASLAVGSSGTVVINVDSVSGCEGGYALLGDCSSSAPTQGSCNLYTALVAAGAETSEDVKIVLPAGNHELCDAGAQKGFSGMTINNTATALAITAPDGATLVEGPSQVGFWTLLHTEHHDLTLTNLLINGGNSQGMGQPGGLVVEANATVILDECSFTGNMCSRCMAGSGGGSIHNNGGTVSMKGGLISNGHGGCATSQGADGGAIFNAGMMSVEGATFSHNTADCDGNGGAIANSGHLSVTNCTFVQNTAGGKGAAILGNLIQGSTCSQSGNVFDHNTGCANGVGPGHYTPCKTASDGADVIGC